MGWSQWGVSRTSLPEARPSIFVVLCIEAPFPDRRSRLRRAQPAESWPRLEGQSAPFRQQPRRLATGAETTLAIVAGTGRLGWVNRDTQHVRCY